MNKRELIARVQRHMGAGASRDAARAAVNAVLDSILQAAQQDGKAHIAHLGSFEYREHRERSGQGLPGVTPAATRNTRRLCYTPARQLKQRISRLNTPPH